MANFFKDYQREIREKRQAEQAHDIAKQKRVDYIDSLTQGARVKINPLYDPRRSTALYSEDFKKLGIMYFVSRLSDDSVLLATDKQTAKSGYGRIYSIFDIIA